jgi:hypothetical protein
LEYSSRFGDLGDLEPGVGAVFSDKAPAEGRLLYGDRKNLDFLVLIMSKDIRTLYEQLKKTPFPELGKVVGDFAFYDSLLAGTASSYLNGAIISPESVPWPDEETEEVLKSLRKKQKRTEQEAELLAYASLLDQLREEIAKASKPGPSAKKARFG